MKKSNKEFIKGVIVGHIFTIEAFRGYFARDFAKALDSVDPPLSSIIQFQIAEILLGENDEEMTNELYTWVKQNYGKIFTHIDRAYMRDLIEHVLKISAPSIHLN